jgi:hypothetical protein
MLAAPSCGVFSDNQLDDNPIMLCLASAFKWVNQTVLEIYLKRLKGKE